MSEDRGTLRRVAWGEVFPWILLGRALRLAIQPRLLVLAAAALLLTTSGFAALAYFLGGPTDSPRKEWMASYAVWPWAAPIPSSDSAGPPGPWGPENERRGIYPAVGLDHPVLGSWMNLSRPFFDLFGKDRDKERSLPGLAFVLLAGLWTALIWAFAGGVITRLVSLNVGRGERGSLRAAFRHVGARYWSYFAAPLYPLFGVLLLIVPVALVGLVGQLGGAGLAAIALVWPLFLLVGLLMTVSLAGLLFGWPLMWPTISTEGTDSFDALSRSYSYVFQRLLYYLFLALLALLLGAIGWKLVYAFAYGVQYLTAWAVSWGAGSAALNLPDTLPDDAPVAARLFAFWDGFVTLLATSFPYTFFFSAATIIYYLMRQSVDGTEIDEVFIEEQPEKFGLPPLAPDAAGVPTVAEPSATDELAAEAADDE
ncbi:MAG: hypothetical protein HYX69_04780 [Planctomycetia bacterium]|nr:hypothetical protein [Planctomycetia bacterium]